MAYGNMYVHADMFVQVCVRVCECSKRALERETMFYGILETQVLINVSAK